MNEQDNISMRLRERGGRYSEIDFLTTRHLLVAGGSASDRQSFFASFSAQLVAHPIQKVCCDDCELAEYDMIDIMREALAANEIVQHVEDAPTDRFVVIDDLAPLMKFDAPFFNDALHTFAATKDRARYHVIAGLGDTWRGVLSDRVAAMFDGRIAYRCENAQGYRVVLGRAVKNPPGCGEFYCVENNGRTRLCSLCSLPSVV